MVVEGTQPGVQLYTGNFLPGDDGKGGVKYAKQTAFCLETQVRNSNSITLSSEIITLVTDLITY